MIKPTIGRKVWYRPSLYDKSAPDSMSCSMGQPLDATVVYVHGDRTVNLVIFDASGDMHKRSSVQLLQDDDSSYFSGAAYAEWMPYQTAQAAKEVEQTTGVAPHST